MAHALGFYHEQSRTDRDNYVEIKKENIKQGMGHNFDEAKSSRNLVNYDYISVMHYGDKVSELKVLFFASLHDFKNSCNNTF